MKSFNQACSNSLLEKEFIQFLKNENINVISFDIFETLLFRQTLKPLDLFLNIGSKKTVKQIFDTADNFQQQRIVAEKQAHRLYAHLEDINLEHIYQQLPLSQKQQQKLISIELKEESKSLFVNAQIEHWIDLAHQYQKKIIFISDMYLTQVQLESILSTKLKNYDLIDSLFVSNEFNATKATGNLFLKVLEQLSIKNKQLLHIGDNKQTDIESAIKLGINTLHYASHKYPQSVFKIEESYLNKQSSLHYFRGHNYRVLTGLLNPYQKKQEQFFYHLGSVIFAPILWEFANWISIIAKKRGITQINCVMREGRLFKEVIEEVNKDIKVNLIYASRKSTFLPSLNAEELLTNGFDFYQYRQSSIKNFYDLFRLQINNQLIKKHQNVLIQDANKIRHNAESLLNVISKNIKSRIDEISKNIQIEKGLFIEYFDQLNINKNSILIDFGGTGTILRNIKKILPKSKQQKLNVLFYMHESGFNKMLGDNILSFLSFNEANKKEIELIRRSHELIEILFNGHHTTTLHYEKKNNKIIPITDKLHSQLKSQKAKLTAFDKGIERFFKLAKKYNLKRSTYHRNTLLSLLSRLIDIPTSQEANYIGALKHVESYGNVGVSQLIAEKQKKILSKLGTANFYYQYRSNIAYKIGEISWPQGLITCKDADYIQNIQSITSRGVNADVIEKIINTLDENPKIQSLYIYGTGQLFLELLPELECRKIEIKGLIDSQIRNNNHSIENYKVHHISDVSFLNGDTIVVASAVFAVEITDTLVETIKNYSVNIINYFNGLLEHKN